MRTWSLSLAGCLLLSVAASAAPAHKLFVANLTPRNVSAGVAQTIDTALCSTARADKRFDVVCPDEVKAILQADAMNAMLGGGSVCEGDGCGELLAQRVKADLMVTGSLSKLEKGKYVLTLDLVDMASAKSIARIEEQINGSEEQVYKRAPGAVKKLLAKAKHKAKTAPKTK